MNEKILKNLDILKELDQKSFGEHLQAAISDDTIEQIAIYIEDFYGLDDDDEIGMLTQVFVSGILCSSNLSN